MAGLFDINKPPRGTAAVTFIILLCLGSRVPQLISPHLMLDGDECVVSLMAKHMMQGKEFPLFFWGQKYGLSIFECLAIIPFASILGMKTIAVKLAMLSLWTAGVVFLFKTLSHIDRKRTMLPLLLITLFILNPAWAVWSMKARGGYLTAFFFSSLALYILFHEGSAKKNISYIFLGILLVLVYEGQALWLLSLLPIYAYRLITERKVGPILYLFCSASVVYLLFYFIQKGLPSYYSPQVYMPDAERLPGLLVRIPEYLYTSLHGHYFFAYIYKPDLFSAIAAVMYFAIIVVLLLLGFSGVLSPRERLLFICSSAGLLFTLSGATLTYSIEARYLLPVNGAAILCLTALFKDLKPARWLGIPYCILMISGLVSMIAFYNYKFSRVSESEMRSALAEIERKGIHHLFCLDDMISWSVNFHSDEKILCRSTDMPGRYPPYVQEINAALFSGKKTGVFHYSTNDYLLEFKNRQIIGPFYLCEYPDAEVLKRTFRFE